MNYKFDTLFSWFGASDPKRGNVSCVSHVRAILFLNEFGVANPRRENLSQDVCLTTGSTLWSPVAPVLLLLYMNGRDSDVRAKKKSHENCKIKT